MKKLSFVLFTILAGSSSTVSAREASRDASLNDSMSDKCLDSAFVLPGERIVACTIAIDGLTLKGSDLAAAHLKRGQAHRATGDEVRAEADYKEATRLFLSGKDFEQPEADQFVKRQLLGDVESAQSDFNDVFRLDTDNAGTHLDRGLLLASRKAQIRLSIIEFDRALTLLPDNVDTLILRGDAFASVGENGRALADLNRAVKLAPANSRARLVRGVINARLGETQRAFSDYSVALDIDPRYVDALVNRGAILASAGNASGAITDLNSAVALAPKNALAAYNRGYARFVRGEYELAIADYSRAIELDGRMGWAYNNRCLARTVLGWDLTGALEDCDEALRLQPDNLQTREARGLIFLKLGESDKAFLEYESALRSDPDRPFALYGRGLARMAAGDLKGGEADRQAALSLRPRVDAEFSPYGLK